MVKGFSHTQIALHWIVAALILFNLTQSDDMSALWRQIKQSGPMPTTTGAWLHIIAGVAVLVLVMWRLMLRATRGVPAHPPGESALLSRAGDAGHLALYVLMFAMPVTGLVTFYGGFPALGEVHGGILKVLLWGLIGLHVVAAFYHHFILKDGLLNRMRKAG